MNENSGLFLPSGVLLESIIFVVVTHIGLYPIGLMRGSHGVNKVNKAVHKINKPFSSHNFVDFIAVGKKLNFI